MAIWWITAIGFILCLFFVGATMVYFLKGPLNSEDSHRIDPVKNDDE